MNFKINIPYTANLIIEKLYEHGFEAFVVGGCVRDSLLGLTPNDWDICTSATPAETMNIFKEDYNIIETGLKHGTITLIDESKEPYEITTYRIDGEYEDNRKPKSVEFTTSLKEDLSRRDFTINAMAYNNKEGLIDYFGGIKDLEDKVLRCVGNPLERVDEDALRILRAFRFKAKYDFELDKSLICAILQKYNLLNNISKERIQSELSKIIMNDSYVLAEMYRASVLQETIPEFIDFNKCLQNNPYHYTNVMQHTLVAMHHSKNDLIIRLALLFHDIGKPQCKTTDDNGIDHFYGHPKASKEIAEKVLKRLRYDNKTITDVLTLIEYHDCDLKSSRSIKRMLNKIGEDNFNRLLEIKYADINAQNPLYLKERVVILEEVKKKLQNILEQKQCFSIKDLKINGRDLMGLGIKQGRDIGIILNKLLETVIDDSSLNEKEKLIELSKEYIN